MPKIDIPKVRSAGLARGAFDFNCVTICNLRLLLQNLIDSPHRSSAALENIDDPPQGDDGPGKLHHVDVEGHNATQFDVAINPLATAQPQYHYHGKPEHGFERWEQHTH